MSEKFKKIIGIIIGFFSFIIAFILGSYVRDKRKRVESVRDELKEVGRNQSVATERIESCQNRIESYNERLEESESIIAESESIIDGIRKRAEEKNN